MADRLRPKWVPLGLVLAPSRRTPDFAAGPYQAVEDPTGPKSPSVVLQILGPLILSGQ
jgi:hypothetical protein